MRSIGLPTMGMLRTILAEIAPSLLKRDDRPSNDNKNALPRDTLSAKRDPTPFGKRGLKAAADAEPEVPEWKRHRQRGRR
jgi:hypothetical protein